MTEPGDPVSRRYRELAREEPGASLDDAILAASRRAAGARPGGKRTGTSRWMGPVSIAAVLVLGIGVSLRMQLEKPGIETSMPTQSSGEYSVPPADEAPAPPPQPKSAPEEKARARHEPAATELAAAARPDATAPEKKKADTRGADAEKPLAKRLETPALPAEAELSRSRPEPNPFTDAPVVPQQAPVPASPAVAAITAPSTVPPPPAPRAAGASAPAGALSPQSAPLRAKREAFAADNAARESSVIGATADPDPTRELERIARLREAGRHADADRALEELRRRHPDFRIPEAMWERVRPR